MAPLQCALFCSSPLMNGQLVPRSPSLWHYIEQRPQMQSIKVGKYYTSASWPSKSCVRLSWRPG